MNKRRVHIFLSTVLIAVWGFVYYRFSAPQSAPEPVLIEEGERTGKAITSEKKYTLLLNYDDPFLGNINPKPEKSVVSEHTAANRKVLNPPVTIKRWPVMKYYGLIANKANETRLGLLDIDNVSYIVRPQAVIQDCRIVAYNEDSIGIAFCGEIRYITKH